MERYVERPPADPLGKVAAAEHDGRLSRPEMITDPNGNRTAFAVDALAVAARDRRSATSCSSSTQYPAAVRRRGERKWRYCGSLRKGAGSPTSVRTSRQLTSSSRRALTARAKHDTR